VELSLPDEVRAALTDAGLSDDEVQGKTGDELRETMGDRLTYELVVALAGQRLTVARSPGRRAKMPQDDLIERNLDILKLRLIDGLNFAQIGREVGLTNSRVSEILRDYFGVDRRPALHDEPVRILYVTAADVPVLREALLGRLLGTAEDLVATVRAGDDDWYAAWSSTQNVMYLLLEVQKDEDTEINIGKADKPKSIIVKALRDHAEVTRNLSDEDGAATCERLLAAMP
jgi:Sigma-70, region 4